MSPRLILVVLADEARRRGALEVLRSTRHEIVTAPSPRAALTSLREDPDRFAVLVTDPSRSAEAARLAADALAAAPHLRVVRLKSRFTGDDLLDAVYSV